MTSEIKKQNPDKSEMVPYLNDKYELYCLWKSLPAFFKYPPKAKDGTRPTSEEFVKRLGIDDEKVISLVSIKTQGEFAIQYELHPDTLTDWNKTQRLRNSLDDIRNWARSLSKNVLMSLYNTCVRKGFAQDVKLFFQLVEGWEEKTQTDVNFSPITKIEIIRDARTKNTMGIDGQTSDSVGLPE